MENSIIEKNENRKNVLNRIKTVIIERLNLNVDVNFVDDDSPLFGMGLGLDSIDALELVVGIEEEFDISIENEDLQVFLSVNTIADYVMNKTQKQVCSEIELNPQIMWLPAYKALRENILVYKQTPGILKMEDDGEALDFISNLVSGNDIVLETNRSIYTSLLNEEGNIIDFVYVMMFEEHFEFICSSKDSSGYKWIIEQAGKAGRPLQEINGFEQVICEGPFSWKLVKNIAGFEVTGLNYLHFMDCTWNDKTLTVFRAGVSNEYGFRFFVPEENAKEFIEYLSSEYSDLSFYYEENNDFIKSVFDLASKEVRFPKLGEIIKEGSSPLINEIRWMADIRKENFIGKDAVLAQKDNITKKIIAFITEDSSGLKIDCTKDNFVFIENNKIGKVLSLQYSYTLKKYFGYAEIDCNYAYACAEYSIALDDKTIKITTSSTPLFLTKSAVIQME